MVQKTEEILENVAWLIDALDDTALKEVQDIPFLEIAKAVSITPSAQPRSLHFRCLSDNRHLKQIPAGIPHQETRDLSGLSCAPAQK